MTKTPNDDGHPRHDEAHGNQLHSLIEPDHSRHAAWKEATQTETEPPLVTHDPSPSASETLMRPQLHSVVDEFQVGVAGEPTPTPTVVSDASALVQQIENVAKSVELSVDVDGALSFVVVLQDDTLITGEFTPTGELYAWRYDKTDWSARTGKIDAEPNVLAIRGWLE